MAMQCVRMVESLIPLITEVSIHFQFRTYDDHSPHLQLFYLVLDVFKTLDHFIRIISISWSVFQCFYAHLQSFQERLDRGHLFAGSHNVTPLLFLAHNYWFCDYSLSSYDYGALCICDPSRTEDKYAHHPCWCACITGNTKTCFNLFNQFFLFLAFLSDGLWNKYIHSDVHTLPTRNKKSILARSLSPQVSEKTGVQAIKNIVKHPAIMRKNNGIASFIIPHLIYIL